MLYILNWVFVVIFLLIPITIVCLRFKNPIKWDRLIVGKWLTWSVVCYVSAACLWLVVNNHFYPTAKPSGISLWTYFFSISSTLPDISPLDYSGGRLFYRFTGILGFFVCNVLLVSTLISFLSRLREKWKEGRLYYDRPLYGKNCENYVVIILGNHDCIFEIAKQCLRRKNAKKPDYVVILMEGDVNEYRGRMYSTITGDEIKKVIFCKGSLTSRLDLENIHIEKASEVFIVGNTIEQYGDISRHDADCIRCVRTLRGFTRESGFVEGVVRRQTRPEHCGTLICRVFLEYQTSYSVFQTCGIEGNERWPGEEERSGTRVIAFKPLNFYELCCEKVIGGKNNDNSYYIPIDGEDGIKAGSPDYVHVIIIGQTKIGAAFGIETAHLAHFPNFFDKKEGKRIGPRTRITFIDTNADVEKNYFMGRLPEVFNYSPWRYRDLSSGYVECKTWNEPEIGGHLGEDFIDIEWEFVKGDVASEAVRRFLIASVNDSNAKCTLAVCFHDQNQSAATALYLPNEVCTKAQEILVFQSRDGSVIDEVLKFDNSGRYSKLRPFGSINRFYDDEECDKMESNFDYELTAYNSGAHKEGKAEIARWWSNRYRYLMSWIKIRSFGMENLLRDQTAVGNVEHSRWNMEQLLLGFRPLTEKEQKDIITVNDDGSVTVDNEKKIAYKIKKAHLDICSCEALKKIDPDVIKYDYPSDSSDWVLKRYFR